MYRKVSETRVIPASVTAISTVQLGRVLDDLT